MSDGNYFIPGEWSLCTKEHEFVDHEIKIKLKFFCGFTLIDRLNNVIPTPKMKIVVFWYPTNEIQRDSLSFKTLCCIIK